ncbi:hypothetical protein [Sphingorhabdus sp. EL138]|uniref:hypothetical protein n=1 Tax=Sphingorhabdus sp. EL138 TaxID=2073156 RepID=UPI0025EBCBE5|nr:hypothetical protein [Sphingorhabdus sp. EL138]
MTEFPKSKQYERTSPWSINANGRAYSIDPWSFQSTNITILDLRLNTKGPNKWGWDNDQVSQIVGMAKFPDFGFIGGEDYPNRLLEMGEYVIFPIDDEAIETEFQKGLQHFKSALGDYRDEFDQLSPIEISEKFGDPHKCGVCRITGGLWSDGFFRIYVGRDIFDQISSEILRTGVSEISIRFRLWNAYVDGEFYPHYAYGNKAHLYTRLFLQKEQKIGLSDYVSHGIIDEININYSYDKILTNSGLNYEKDKIIELSKNIIKLKQNLDSLNESISKIYLVLKSIFIFALIISVIFAIWR